MIGAVAAVVGNPATADKAAEVQAHVMQLDLTTAFAFIACVLSIGALIFKSGGHAQAQKSFEHYSNRTDTEHKKWREDFEKSVESRFAAVSGATTLAREQIGDVRENLAKNYMVKSEIKEIENRVTSSQDRILDHLDKIDTRLNEMQSRVLEAINKATSRG
jgi:hypothetical protein